MLDTVKINHVQHISFTQSLLTDAVSVILRELLSYEHPSKCGEGLFIANSEEKYRKRNGGNSMQSNCETCMYFGYDEEFEEYFCEVNLDEDEMEKFLTDSFQGGCPYYRLEDEYRTVRKQM